MGVNELVKSHLRHIDYAFADLIEGEGYPTELFLVPGVPRIRPMLLLLSACALQREQEFDRNDVEHLALAVEMCAAAITLHDAALGQQGGLRRRVARKILGRVKTLAGNQLFVRSVKLLMQVSSGSEYLSEFLTLFSDVLQTQQFAQSWKDTIPSPEELLEHHAHHSTLLFSFVCRSGARLAGADPKSIGVLGRYGSHMGIVWLIAEELFWLMDSQETALQFLRSQASHQEPPYLMTLVYDDVELQQMWSELCMYNRMNTAEKIYHKVLTKRLLNQAIQTMVEHCFVAESTIRSLDSSPHRDALISLLWMLCDELKGRL